MKEGLTFIHDAVISGQSPGFLNSEFRYGESEIEGHRMKHQHKQRQQYKFSSRVKFHFENYVVSPFVLLASIATLILLPENITTERITQTLRRSTKRVLKRALDIVLSTIGLIVSSPFFLILPILIKLDSKGTVFYKQLRVGKNRRRRDSWENRLIYGAGKFSQDRRKARFYGKPFFVFKFRTMKKNAELTTGPVWASKDDSRITRVGKLLRKTHLDELPQFINVLKGEMSLVGPRPERPYFVSKFAESIADYPKRFNIKPGITGKAQITCGYDTSITDVKKKLEHEMDYISNHRMFEDFKLITLSVWTMITRKGDA